jgi:hypothetical protein
MPENPAKRLHWAFPVSGLGAGKAAATDAEPLATLLSDATEARDELLADDKERLRVTSLDSFPEALL